MILTGDVSKAAINEIARHGHPRLVKPVNADELLGVIQRLLVGPVIDGWRGHAIVGSVDGASGVTIFVVDDDYGTRETLKELIEIEGGTVEAYESADAFLKAYQPGRKGCLVVDAKMPGMSGLALLDRLRDDGDRLPAIMITAHGDAGDRRSCDESRSGRFDRKAGLAR